MSEENKKIYISVFMVLFFLIGIMGMCIYVSSNGVYSENGVEDKRKIGATYMTMNNSYFKIINEEIRYKVEENGDTLITRDPALSLEKQIDEIYEFIDLKVSAIFINPVDWIGVRTALADAKKAGIKIIAIDTDVFDDGLIECTVVSDNYDAGVQCAKELMKNREHANIILLEHTSAKSAIDRIRGFEETVSKNENYKILERENCDGQLETAMPVVEELLAEHDDVDTIMALNDPSALGAIMALEDMHINNVDVYGIDGSPDGKKVIKENKMAATVSQSPRKIGEISGEVLYKIFNRSSVDKKIVVPVEIINRDNVDNYKLDAWQ
ncbi:MAG: sugar ABC transporter substrate-binding protein [Clostridium sp.]|nr:sugar ABC transporter substrate-binding protein [Clostridium sp.]